MKPVIYNDKGYETTNFGLGIMDYEKSHKTNENKQYTNMNKKLIRLTEQDLHRIVKESANRVLNEVGYEGNLQDTEDYNKAVKCVKFLMDYAVKNNNNTLQSILMKVMEEMSISWQWFKTMQPQDQL